MIGFNLKKNRGFTLLEALVAISILMVAVAAPITIAQKGLSSAIYSKNQMIASYLAQDAIEYIINQRDQYSIRNNFDWANFLTAFNQCIGANSCQIDTNANGGDGQIQPYTSGLLSKNGNGFYGFSGTPTNFTRQIQIANPNDGNAYEALITVTVSWGSVGNTVVVKTLIYNY